MPSRLCTTTSARRASSTATARSAPSARSRVTPSLLRLTHSKYADELAVHGGPQARVSSPTPGRSTLITVAPRSASVIVASGPASTRLKSATNSPDNGVMPSSDQTRLHMAARPERPLAERNDQGSPLCVVIPFRKRQNRANDPAPVCVRTCHAGDVEAVHLP